MPGRPIEESIRIRKWIDAALKAGRKSPSQVLEWIEQNKDDEMESPTLPTVGSIMRELGYRPTDKKWEKE